MKKESRKTETGRIHTFIHIFFHSFLNICPMNLLSFYCAQNSVLGSVLG